MQHAARVAEGRREQSYQPRNPGIDLAQRQVFHKPHTSLGAAGHWIHLASVMAPLVIGEVIKDSEKRWRAIRLASIGTALLTEAVWTYRMSKKTEEQEARMRECQKR